MSNNIKYIKEELEALYQEERFLTERQEEYWKYHPNNPHRVDVTEEYNNISEQLSDIGNKIKKLKEIEVRLN